MAGFWQIHTNPIRNAASQVEAAKLQLTQRVKEVAAAKRTLAAREREERSAMKKVEEVTWISLQNYYWDI